MVFFIFAIITITILLIIYIVANLPQICILGFCWTPVHQAVASKFNFYFVVALWFICQAIVIYSYYKIFQFASRIPRKYKSIFDSAFKKIGKLVSK